MKILIYCCVCDKNVRAELVIHHDKFFWECINCRQSVGTFKDKKNDYAPLGPIPSKKIRKLQEGLKKEIDSILELKRDTPDAKEKLFDWLSKKLFVPYRTEMIFCKKEAATVKQHLAFLKSKIQK